MAYASKKKIREYTHAQEYISGILPDIEIDLIYAAQLSFNNGILVNQYTNQPIKFGDKFICYPKNLYPNNKSIVPFDPFNNPKMASLIMKLFCAKYEMENHVNINLIFLSNVDRKGYGVASCRFESGKTIDSGKYTTESLRFIDLIFRMDYNLTVYLEGVLHELDEKFAIIRDFIYNKYEIKQPPVKYMRVNPYEKLTDEEIDFLCSN